MTTSPRAQELALRAADLADSAGLDSLTPALLARAAGITPPAVYRHFAGTRGIVAAVRLIALREIVPQIADAMAGRSGFAAIQALADGLRAWARRHPGRYQAMQRAADADDDEATRLSARFLELVGAAIDGFGLPPAARIDAIRFARATIHGFIMLEATGGFGMPDSVDDSYLAAVRALRTALAEWPAPAQGPPAAGIPPGAV